MAMDMDMDLGVGLIQTRHRTPDSDAETPPRNPPTKRVHHTARVSYKECMKNHAASIGGHALDGCCEFMPGPLFNPADPTSLKCGACGCHRNFHRRDPDDPTPLNHHPMTAARRAHSPPTASQLLLSLSQSPSGPSDEINLNSGACGGILVGYTGGQNGNFLGSGSGSGSSKKRFRTKFSQEQKEKMYEFSEKIGWKLRKGEERLIEEFVKEIGVERSVFKVWMHNNKHTSSTSTTTPKLQNDVKIIQDHPHVVSATTTTTTTAVNFEQQLLHQQQQQQQQHNSSNGSKSSSSNNNNNNNVGNCGASVFDNHNHHHHHRQFSFANGGGQEAAQAQ